MAVPKLQKITVNIGLRRKRARTRSCWTPRQLSWGQIHRAESRDHPGEEVHREFQNSQGHAHRLRGDFACAATRCTNFLDRLCNVVLPRVRDFRGCPRILSTAAGITRWD